MFVNDKSIQYPQTSSLAIEISSTDIFKKINKYGSKRNGFVYR